MATNNIFFAAALQGLTKGLNQGIEIRDRRKALAQDLKLRQEDLELRRDQLESQQDFRDATLARQADLDLSSREGREAKEKLAGKELELKTSLTEAKIGKLEAVEQAIRQGRSTTGKGKSQTPTLNLERSITKDIGRVNDKLIKLKGEKTLIESQLKIAIGKGRQRTIDRLQPQLKIKAEGIAIKEAEIVDLESRRPSRTAESRLNIRKLQAFKDIENIANPEEIDSFLDSRVDQLNFTEDEQNEFYTRIEEKERQLLQTPEFGPLPTPGPPPVATGVEPANTLSTGL